MTSPNPDATARSAEKQLRDEIQALGFDWRGVKKVLPDWATDAGATKAGQMELRGFVQRHLGLSLNSKGQLAPAGLPEARFKTTSGTSVHDVDAARATATACARIVAGASSLAWAGVTADPKVVRSEVCKANKDGWVDLAGLLDFCWQSGVPVLYLPSLPTSGRKMEGMVTFLRGRPVIVLSKKSDHPDWMVFILAHELGHIALKHLTEADGEAIVDDTVDRSESNDVQEKEANKFATSVLTPAGNGLRIAQQIPKAPQLAQIAIDYGRKHGISPGHVILSAARHTTLNGQKLFALGAAALKSLPKSITGGTTAEICRAAARRHLDFEALKSDSVEYLEKLGVI